jgi:predicted nuclease of predicted toxin-antitoxin system
LNFLIDENMPRSLLLQIETLGFTAQDVRDIGLRGRPDTEVMQAALAADAIIITRDRGFTFEKGWPKDFTAGVVFVNLPEDTQANDINARIISLLTQRLPVSLLGSITIVELQRALS